MDVKVLWDTLEEGWEPLNKIKADDPITLAKYVEAKGLVDKPYWKWANRYGIFAAVHNNLKVLAADIGNAYLHAKTNEKLYTILPDEFGSLAGKVLVFV